MKKYINFRSNYGVETIDELSLSDFVSRSAFNKELNRIVSEYRIAGMSVYTSQRACKDWK